MDDKNPSESNTNTPNDQPPVTEGTQPEVADQNAPPQATQLNDSAPQAADNPSSDVPSDTYVESTEAPATPPETTQPAVVTAMPFGQQKQPKSKRKLLAVVVGLIVVLISAALLAYYFNKSEDESAKQTVYIDIPVVKVGGLDGPIGNDYIFPNPQSAQMSREIDFQVYEGLVGYDDQKLVPLLASSWTTPNDTTWVFTIKQGVKFQNGKPLTAQDVKSSLEYLQQDRAWGSYIQTIKEVAVSADDQVTITTASPDSLLVNRLAYGFIFSKNDDGSFSGTGAYTVDTEKSNTETATRLVAYEGYHQGAPKTKAVEYTVFESPDAVYKALQDKQIDVGRTIKNEEAAKPVVQNGFTVYDFNATSAYGLTLNMVKQDTPLATKEVREALAYALNRPQYITDTKSVRDETYYVVPKSVVGYDETAKYPEYNQQKVTELLAAAGYPNGVNLTFNYIEGLQADAPTIIDQLNKAGFKVTAKAFATPKEFVIANSSGDYDLFVGRFDSDLGDGLDIFSGILGSQTSQFPSYNNPEFDAMIAEAEKAFQPEEHLKKVQELNRYAASNYLWLPLANTDVSIFSNGNYNYKVDSLVGIVGAYYWKLGQAQQDTASN